MKTLPRSFVFRRLHSLLGLGLVIYLFEHLAVNFQAAFYLQDQGQRFIKLVDRINTLPALPLIEFVFLGLPFFIHMAWGIIYLRTGKYNSFHTSGEAPSLAQYKRNQAYTWQRITSWILVVGVIAHVAHMRFIDRPQLTMNGAVKEYQVRITQRGEKTFVTVPTMGAAFLLVLRETFHSPLMAVLYSAFVLAACFHGFNGMWTFMITWGLTLSLRSQARMRYVTNVLMFITAFMGLAAIWVTFWMVRWR